MNFRLTDCLELLDFLEEYAEENCSCKKRKVAAAVLGNREEFVISVCGPPMIMGPCKICLRLNSEPTKNTETCPSLHAEHEAILHAVHQWGLNLSGKTIFTTHFPCPMCFSLIVFVGIKEVIYRNDYSKEVMDSVKEKAKKLEIQLIKM